MPEKDIIWSNNERPNIKVGGKCSWKHLHGVDSMHIDPTQFVALMRSVERDMIIAQVVVLTQPVINMNPNANGRRLHIHNSNESNSRYNRYFKNYTK